MDLLRSVKHAGRIGAVLVVLAGCVATGHAQDAHYLDPASLDLTQLRAPPPAEGSPAAAGDLAAVMRMQKIRTPAEIAGARADTERSVFRFADVLGPNFAADRLPVTAQFRSSGCPGSDGIGSSDQAHRNRPKARLRGSSPRSGASCGTFRV